MKIMVLDDDDHRHVVIGKMLRRKGHQVTHVSTYADAIKVMQDEVFEGMYLDHDLNETCEQTGMQVVEYIVNKLPKDKKPKQVVIHSWNPPGAKAMEDLLRWDGIAVRRDPFNSLWL